jgi:hypothetical protein
MTELQMTIVAAAVIVLAWIGIINFSESRRARKRLAAQKPVDPEPIFSAPVERVTDPILPSDISESVAELKWATPMPVAKIQQELRGWRRVGSKPLAFGWVGDHGRAPRAEPGATHAVTLLIGVLLATRTGPINAMEYSEWHEELQRLAAALNAQLTIPSMTEVLTKAKSLDQRCASVDAQLTLAVTSREVLSAQAMGSAAHAAGLESRGELRYAMGPLHHQLFSVFPGESGNRMVLLLDVPRTRDPVHAFAEMRKTAEAMATLLYGSVTDESGRPLAEQDLDAIAEQVASRESALMSMGIIPGSALAQRLFL